MRVNEYLIFLAIGGVLALSLFIALIASRFGVPSLVAFLVLGMILGSDGIGHIQFQNIELARTIGMIGLAVILFEGGLSTSWRRLREVALPAISLSTIGVAATALLAGVAAYHLFDLPWLSAFLLGAVVSSTDVAAVFATLRFTKIKRRLARTLEAESAGNDPMAIALTVGLIAWIQHPTTYGVENLAFLMIQQLVMGLIVGVLLGAAAMFIFARLPHSIGSFAPVASLAAGALAFGIAGSIGGSGFLAIYLVGLAIGSTPSRYRSQLTAFHEGLAFLAQVSMFLVLGLLVSPHSLLPVAGASILLALILVVFVRPLAIWLSIPFGNFSANDRLLLGWAGLRGAVPIILGTIVLSSHIPHSETIFNAVFFVVLVSALVQGTTLERVAAKLNLLDVKPEPQKKQATHYKPAIDTVTFDVIYIDSINGSRMNELGLPHHVTLKQIKRNRTTINPTAKTVVHAGDRLVISVPQNLRPELEDVFTRWRRRV